MVAGRVVFLTELVAGTLRGSGNPVTSCVTGPRSRSYWLCALHESIGKDAAQELSLHLADARRFVCLAMSVVAVLLRRLG